MGTVDRGNRSERQRHEQDIEALHEGIERLGETNRGFRKGPHAFDRVRRWTCRAHRFVQPDRTSDCAAGADRHMGADRRHVRRARAGHTATTLFDGRVVIAGGDDAGVTVDSIEVFDPYEGVFTLLDAVLTNPRTGHAAALSYDGLVVIAGGFDGTHALASLDVYNPYENAVTSGASLATARAGH